MPFRIRISLHKYRGIGRKISYKKVMIWDHKSKKDNGNGGDISIYGQEFNHTTWKLARMNMAIRENVQANLRRLVKRILNKYGYPMMNIHYNGRNSYYNALERSQLKKDDNIFLQWFFKRYIKENKTYTPS